MFGAQRAVQNNDTPVGQPPSDSISKMMFCPCISPMGGGQDLLAVASWDNNVRIYSVNNQGVSEPKAMYSHDKPVLDLAWNQDGTKLYSGGCDGAVKCFDLSTGQATTMHTHAKPVRCLAFAMVQGVVPTLVSAGWDLQLRYWNLNTNTPILNPENAPLMLSDRPYAMSSNDAMLVIGTADRKVTIIKWAQPFVIFKQEPSPLRWQTRVISCFPKVDAYAIGSVEGRVGIQYPFHDDSRGAANPSYSFKCHRYDITGANAVPQGIQNHASSVNTTAGSSQNSQHVFAVNDICFHKEMETFCTAGADGSITFWDGVGRTKLKGFTLKELANGDQDVKPIQFGSPVVSCSFNPSHTIFAYALSYDWSKGHSGVPQESQTHLAPRIMLHPVKGEEVNKKKK